MFDYKEYWQQAFEEGQSMGMEEEEAHGYADYQLRERYSELIDHYRQEKENMQ